MRKYSGPVKNFAVQSVYTLQVWQDNRNITRSKIALKTRPTKTPNKVLFEYADYDPSSLGLIEGSSSNFFFNFHNWNLIDIFVFAGEGLFSIPPVNLIDAAHLNGVKVLGTIMAPVFQPQYTTQFSLLFCRIGDKFPLGDKLIALTRHYGFDGWFVNIEEPLPSNIDWKDVRDFIIYVEQGLKKFNPEAEMHWYDSDYVFGSSGYQNCLDSENVCMFQNQDTEVSQGFFTNYGWTDQLLEESKDNSIKVGRNPSDVFAGIYFPDSYSSGGIIPAIKTILSRDLSIGLWGCNYIEMADTLQQYKIIEQKVFDTLREVITVRDQPIEIPFCTNMCIGYGEAFWIEGVKTLSQPWGQIASCDLTPVTDLQYITEKVFNGGTSGMIFGEVGEIINLFSTNCQIKKKATLILITDIDKIVEPVCDCTLSHVSTTWINDWVCNRYEIPASVTFFTKLSLIFRETSHVHIGKISLSYDDPIVHIQNPRISHINWQYDDQINISVQLLIEWDDDANRCFDIFYKRPDFGEYKFLKRVYRNSTFIDNVQIKADIMTQDRDIFFKIVAVGFSGDRADLSSAPFVSFCWDPPLNYMSLLPVVQNDD